MHGRAHNHRQTSDNQYCLCSTDSHNHHTKHNQQQIWKAISPHHSKHLIRSKIHRPNCHRHYTRSSSQTSKAPRRVHYKAVNRGIAIVYTRKPHTHILNLLWVEARQTWFQSWYLSTVYVFIRELNRGLDHQRFLSLEVSLVLSDLHQLGLASM